MALRERFNFRGSDADYIAFLEGIIATYQDAAQTDTTDHQQSQSPSRSHETDTTNRPQRQSPSRSHETDTTNHPQRQSPSRSHEDEGYESGLKIIEFKPEKPIITRKEKRKNSTEPPRWETELYDFLQTIKPLESWDLQRKQFSLSNDMVLQIVLYNQSATYHLSPESPRRTSSNDLIRTLREYSAITKNAFSEANTLRGLAMFLELVFLSLCAVSMKIIQNHEHVYNAMKSYVSKGEPTHMDRLMHGAIWANSCISELLTTPWGYRSQEIFLIAGQSTNFYARYSEDRRSSSIFIENMKKKAENFDVHSDMPAPVLMIPLILEKLVGGQLLLSDICKLLGYCPDRIAACRQFFEQSLTATRQKDTGVCAGPSRPASVTRPSQEPGIGNPENTVLQPNKRRRLDPSISNLTNHQTEAGYQLNIGLEERRLFQNPAADLTSSHVHDAQEGRILSAPIDDLLYGPRSCPSLQQPSWSNPQLLGNILPYAPHPNDPTAIAVDSLPALQLAPPTTPCAPELDDPRSLAVQNPQDDFLYGPQQNDPTALAVASMEFTSSNVPCVSPLNNPQSLAVQHGFAYSPQPNNPTAFAVYSRSPLHFFAPPTTPCAPQLKDPRSLAVQNNPQDDLPYGPQPNDPAALAVAGVTSMGLAPLNSNVPCVPPLDDPQSLAIQNPAPLSYMDGYGFQPSQANFTSTY